MKLKAIKEFTLKRFDELRDLKRNTNFAENKRIYVGDIFECDEELAEYLLGNNPLKEKVVEVIEEPVLEAEVVDTDKVEVKLIKKKKSSKK